jgi:hypothetical protein
MYSILHLCCCVARGTTWLFVCVCTLEMLVIHTVTIATFLSVGPMVLRYERVLLPGSLVSSKTRPKTISISSMCMRMFSSMVKPHNQKSLVFRAYEQLNTISTRRSKYLQFLQRTRRHRCSVAAFKAMWIWRAHDYTR